MLEPRRCSFRDAPREGGRRGKTGTSVVKCEVGMSLVFVGPDEVDKCSDQGKKRITCGSQSANYRSQSQGRHCSESSLDQQAS